MNIRQEILKGTDWEEWVNDQGVEKNEKKHFEASLVVIKEDKPIDKLVLDKKKKRFFFGKQS